jgi:hypothetical protein
VPSSLRISGHGTSSIITDTSTILLSSPPDDEHFDSLASLVSSLPAVKPHPKSVDLKQLQSEIADITQRLANIQIHADTWASHLVAINTRHAGPCHYNPDRSADPVTERIKEALDYLDNERQMAYEVSRTLEDKRSLEGELRAEIEAWDMAEKKKWEKNAERKRKEKEERGKVWPSWQVSVTVEAELPSSAPVMQEPVPDGRPEIKGDQDAPTDAKGPSLRVAYIVRMAGWNPRFELQFDTESQRARLWFRGEVWNVTGEKWEDTEVSLSLTEQAKWGRLEEVPVLRRWNLGIEKQDAQMGLFGLKQGNWSNQELKVRAGNSGEYVAPGFQRTTGLFGQPVAPAGVNTSTHQPAGGFGQSTFGGTSGLPAVGVPFGKSAFGQSKFGANPAVGTSGLPAVGVSFGQSAFGQTQPASGLGASTSTFTGGALFGSAQPATNTASSSGASVFGTSASPFGAFAAAGNATPSSGSAGGPSLFGSSATTGGFGASTNQNLFGAPATGIGAGLFGQPTTTSNVSFRAFGSSVSNAAAGNATPSSGSAGGPSLFGSSATTGGFGASTNQNLFGAPATGIGAGLFGQPTTTSNVSFRAFGSSVSNAAPPSGSNGALFNTPIQNAFGAASPAPDSAPSNDTGLFSPSSSTTDDPTPSTSSTSTPIPFDPYARMSSAISTTITSGTATTFLLPSRKTLSSSTQKTRFLISSLNLGFITLSYQIVPKLRAAAFLTATVTLPALVSPLREGHDVAITVDSIFLGTAKCPKRSLFGNKITFPIGVEEGIEVEYQAPQAKKESRGMMLGKKDVMVYKRKWRVRNRVGKVVEVEVLDQVPVVTEKGRITVVKPEEAKASQQLDFWGGTVKRVKKMEVGEEWEEEVEWEVDLVEGEACVSLE